MYFPVFDWNKSGWVNSREKFKQEAIQAAKKVWVWKKYVGEAEYNAGGRAYIPLENDDGLYYAEAERYAELCELYSETQGTPDGGQWHWDGCTDCVIGQLDKAAIGDLGTTTSSDEDYPDKIIGRISILEMIRGNKAKYNQLGYYHRGTADLMSLQEIRDVLVNAKNYVDTSNGRMIVKWWRTAQPYDEFAVDARFDYRTSVQLQQTTGSLRMDYNMGIYKFPKLALPTYDKFTLLPTGLVNRERISGHVPLVVMDKIVSEADMTDTQWELTQALHHVVGFKPPAEIVQTSMWEPVDLTAITQVLDSAVVHHRLDLQIEEVDRYLALLDNSIDDARDTPVGKLLDNFQYLDQLMETDVSGLNEMYISFRLANLDGVNGLKDEDEKTDAASWKLIKKLSNWEQYFYVVFSRHNYDIGDNKYYPVVYVPKWNKIKSAPNIVFMTILQATVQIDSGIPKPKKETNWANIIMAVIVVVIITFATWGTGTGLALSWGASTLGTSVMAVVAIASSVASIAGELTKSNSEASMYGNLSESLGIISLAGSLGNILTNGIKMTLANVVKYALMATNYGLSAMYSDELGKLKKQSDSIVDEIDEVEEIVANQHLEEMDRVKKFIYGEHITDKYTDRYNYDKLYKIKYT